MHFSCRSFIGKSDTNSWAQYWENEPDDPALIASKGHLFGLVNISLDSEEEDISTIGHDIIFELNQNYFSTDTVANITDSLKNAILSVAKNPLYRVARLEFVIAIVLKNQLFLATYGPGKVILVRGDRIGLILENGTDDVKTIEGPLAFEDKILLLTDSFYQQFTWEKIKTILSYEKIQTIEENFLSLLYSLPDHSGVAAALVQPHSDDGDESFPAEEVKNEVASEPEIISANPPFTPPPAHPQVPIIHVTKDLFSRLQQSQNKAVYVSHHDTKQVNRRKRINIIVVALLLIGLSTSSYFGYQKNRTAKIENQYQGFKTELDSKFENIVAVKNLNINSAQQLAKEAEDIIQKMSALEVHTDEVSRYKSQVQQILTQTGVSDNFTPDLFYDTQLSFKNGHYQKILLKDNAIYLLDNTAGRIDSIDIDEKSGKNISSSTGLKNIQFLTESNHNIFVGSADGIYLLNKNTLESKISFSGKNVTPTDIGFWNGAVYVLDQKDSSIWKITPNSTGYGSPQAWIKNNQKLDSGATSMAINGKIWVLFKDGHIVPYASGNKDKFTPNQENQFTDASNISVTVDSGLIAFSDKNLLYLYKQTGELKAKYNLDKLTIADVAIDDQNNVIYVLCTDQKIYRISL